MSVLSKLQKQTGAPVTVVVGPGAGKEAQVAPVQGAKEKGKLRVRYRRSNQEPWHAVWLAPGEFEVKEKQEKRRPLFDILNKPPPTPAPRKLQRILVESGMMRGPGWEFSEAECADALSTTAGDFDAAYSKLIDGRPADDARPTPTGLRIPTAPRSALVQASNGGNFQHAKFWTLQTTASLGLPPGTQLPWEGDDVLVVICVSMDNGAQLGDGRSVGKCVIYLHPPADARKNHCGDRVCTTKGREQEAHAHVLDGTAVTDDGILFETLAIPHGHGPPQIVFELNDARRPDARAVRVEMQVSCDAGAVFRLAPARDRPCLGLFAGGDELKLTVRLSSVAFVDGPSAPPVAAAAETAGVYLDRLLKAALDKCDSRGSWPSVVA